MSILSENIEAGFPLHEVTHIQAKGAGGWCPNTTIGKVGETLIPGLDIDPAHVAHLVKEVLGEEVEYYARLWHKKPDDVKFRAFYNGFENEINVAVYVDGDKWCSVRITRLRRENPINFINLKGTAYDLESIS